MPTQPRQAPPDNLLYAMIVKRREKARVVEVTTREVYGTPERVAATLEASPTSTMLSTFGVKRNDLTIRQRLRRVGRRVNVFSKERTYLEHQLTLSFAYYHFIPHRSLRQRLEQPIPTKGSKGSLRQ